MGESLTSPSMFLLVCDSSTTCHYWNKIPKSHSFAQCTNSRHNLYGKKSSCRGFRCRDFAYKRASIFINLCVCVCSWIPKFWTIRNTQSIYLSCADIASTDLNCDSVSLALCHFEDGLVQRGLSSFRTWLGLIWPSTTWRNAGLFKPILITEE